MQEKKILNSSNNEQLKVTDKLKVVLSSPYVWFYKELYLIFEQWKNSLLLYDGLRNKVPSQTRTWFWYTLPCWFRHEESGDSDWKEFLLPTLNALWTGTHFLACLYLSRDKFWFFFSFQLSTDKQHRLLPKDVAGWSQRYFWHRSGGDVLWMVLWYCIGAARGRVRASWTLPREFLMWEVGHAKQEKRVSPSSQDLRSLPYIVSSPSQDSLERQ